MAQCGMSPYGRSERELRQRFIRTLSTQEDRLEVIVKEIDALTREADKLRQQVADRLYRLSYNADLQGAGSEPGPQPGPAITGAE